MSDECQSTTSVSSHSLVIFAFCAPVSFRMGLIESDPNPDRICLASNIWIRQQICDEGRLMPYNLVDQRILEGGLKGGERMQPVAASTSIPFVLE